MIVKNAIRACDMVALQQDKLHRGNKNVGRCKNDRQRLPHTQKRQTDKRIDQDDCIRTMQTQSCKDCNSTKGGIIQKS